MLKHNQYRRLSYNNKQMKNAVALSYNQEKDEAPVVVASGAGHVADRIIEIANKANIPIYRDETAAGLLSQLDLGEEIPYELYQIVAEIFAYIVQTSNRIKESE